MSESRDGWDIPPFPRTLADDDPLLTPTDSIQTPERESLRQRIVDSHLAGTNPVTDRRPIMYLMGGGGASGKGVLKAQMLAAGRIPSENVVNLDPDEIKGRIPEYRAIIAAGDSRAAATVHEESSAVSKRVLSAAMDGRRDLAYDVTMGNPAKGRALIDNAKTAGYEVQLYGVTVAPETAVQRNAQRAQKTGRYVPVSSQLEAHKGFSQGFESYAQRADTAQLYDTNGQVVLIAEKPQGGELQVHRPGEYAAFQKKAELDPAASGPKELYPPRAGQPLLFSRGGSRTNREIVDGEEGLPRTRETVDEAAAAGGVDLTDVEVVLIDEPDEIRYLDHQQAYAYTPAELGGNQVRLGPASFADRETLVATLAHEKTHVEQLRAGTDLDSETVKDLEVEAYASEAAALERLKEHDSNQVHGRDHVRPAESGRDPGAGDAGERGDPGRDDAADGGDELAGADPGRGVPDAGERGNEQGDLEDRADGRDGDQTGDDADQSGLNDSAKTEEPTLEEEPKTEAGVDDGLEDDGTEADAAAQVDAQEESEQQAETDAQVQAEDEAEQRGADEQAATEADAQVDKESDQEVTRTEAEDQESTRAESQAQSEEQADRQGEAGSETEAGGADDEPSRAADSQADSEAGADGAEAAAQDEAGAKAESGTDAQAETGAEADAGAGPGAESDADTQAEAEAGAEAEGGAEADAGAEGGAGDVGSGGYEEQAAADDARVAGAMESEDSGGDHEGGDYSYEDSSAGDDMGRE